MALVFWSTPALANPLASFDAAGMHIQLELEDQGAYDLSLTPSQDEGPGATVGSRGPQLPAPKIMVLQNPSRLVVDMPGISPKHAQTLKIKDAYLGAVRLAAFGDGTRIVCDLKSVRELRYVWQKDPTEGRIIVRFSVDPGEPARGGVTSEEPQPTPAFRPSNRPTPRITDVPAFPVEDETPEPTPTPRATPKATPKPALTPEPVPSSTPTPRTTPRPAPTAAATASTLDTEVREAQPGKKASLFAVSFKKTGKTQVPSLVLSIRNLQKYQLRPLSPGSYELVLQSAEVQNRSLLLPQVPPEEFERFEMVVPRVEGEEIRVKILVDKAAVVVPFVIGNELWLKATEE